MHSARARGGINTGRVVLAGILAGVLYNVGGITIASLMDLPGAFARLGWQPTALAGLVHATMRLGFGLISVFLYAGFRPRFGPGPRTAFIAALVVWLSAEVPLLIMFGELHALTGRQVLLGAAWGLIESVVATEAGAWLYREGSVG